MSPDHGRPIQISSPYSQRKQVLKDILKLIDEKRTEGFCPLVMMDANGDANFEGDG